MASNEFKPEDFNITFNPILKSWKGLKNIPCAPLKQWKTAFVYPEIDEGLAEDNPINQIRQKGLFDKVGTAPLALINMTLDLIKRNNKLSIFATPVESNFNLYGLAVNQWVPQMKQPVRPISGEFVKWAAVPAVSIKIAAPSHATGAAVVACVAATERAFLICDDAMRLGENLKKDRTDVLIFVAYRRTVQLFSARVTRGFVNWAAPRLPVWSGSITKD
ncbi:hypothetical protein EJ06DRAFT_584957 [Trichodelitschia bisporula]|uniref:Uncharacterized protein n=1 Tax=Trichodelitschia bisporula TaxID=703511 RepID=A0A6G1HLS7_9PEZI|nr:hypothetical protein EJ06DRAFT_584957 [Trichodelitschia bisporula]